MTNRRRSAAPKRLSRRKRRRLGFELLAILAIAYFPPLLSSVTSLVDHGPSSPSSVNAERLMLLTVQTLFMALPVAYIIGQAPEGWAHFGIKRFDAKRDIGVALAVLALLVPWTGLWNALLSTDTWPFGSAPEPAHGTTLAWLAVVPACLVNAVSEELGMRAYLIPRLRTLLGPTVGPVLFSSLAFASYHVQQGAGAFVVVFMIGLLFGSVFTATRRLWPLVLAHAAWDLLLFARPWILAQGYGV